METSKRRDNKGRVLQNGETQKADGSYQFAYSDKYGRHYVRAWKLTETDPTPKGKKEKPALRTLEKEIQKNLEDGIVTCKGLTLDDVFEKFLEKKQTKLKSGKLRKTTYEKYEEMYNRYVKSELGSIIIGKISDEDVYSLYEKLIEIDELSGGTIKKLNCILNQTFDIAIKKKLIRLNPCDGAMEELSDSYDLDAEKVTALTEKQQNGLLAFVKKSKLYKRWFPFIVFLLGTGTRIGEASGIFWKDIDFKNGRISINHTIAVASTWHEIHEPKTEKGNRIIPLCKDVKNMLLKLRRDSKTLQLDGFVFLNEHGNFINRNWFNQVLKRIAKDYNDEQTNPENRLPENLKSHMLRHTFCTRLCEKKMNPKEIQVIMGHSKVSTTLDVYADAFPDKIAEDFEELDFKVIGL